MAHSISVIITKTKLLKSYSYNNYFISDNNIENFLHVKNNKIDFVVAKTDYFGGLGNQYAYYNGKYYKEHNAINIALELFGVERTDNYDCFQLVGLDEFRSNLKLLDAIEMQKFFEIKTKVLLTEDDYGEYMIRYDEINNTLT